MSYRSRRALMASAAALAAVLSVMTGQNVAAATTTTATVETTADSKPRPTESSTSEPAPVFPQPGGGHQAIIAFYSLGGTQTYVLNTLTGAYQELPYVSVRVSRTG